jgi:hypothetical protein
MEFFYKINIFISLTLLLWPIWFARVVVGLGWVNPFSIVLAISLPVKVMTLIAGPLVLLDRGLFDYGYQFALLMNSAHLFAHLASATLFFVLFRRMRIERYLPWRKLHLEPIKILRSARLFFLIFIVSLLLLATAKFGILNWITNPRLGYQLYRTGQGHWYALAISFLSASYLLSFLARPKPVPLLFSTLLHLLGAYFLGSKGIMLSLFSTMLVFLWFLRWRHLGKMFLLGIPPIFSLLIFNLYLALGDVFELKTVFSYFDYYMNAASYYKEYLDGRLDLFWGEVTLSSYWSYVPRVIWPEKPTVYGILLVNEIFYPGLAELTHTPAFGGAVEQFADFGVIGVVFFGIFSSEAILTALMAYLLFRHPGFDPRRVSLAALMLMLVQFAPGFGAFFPGALYLALLATVLGLVNLVKRVRV